MTKGFSITFEYDEDGLCKDISTSLDFADLSVRNRYERYVEAFAVGMGEAYARDAWGRHAVEAVTRILDSFGRQPA